MSEHFLILKYSITTLSASMINPNKVKNLHFPISSRLSLGPTQPPIQWIPGALSVGE
jgi:hypothetical protein